MKILCTGNPDKNTIAKCIRDLYPETEFVYLSNGYNFLTTDGLDKFRQKVKDFDVFINASRIDIGVQIELLKIVRSEWETGSVINIGTTMEFHYFHHLDKECAIDKLRLRDLGLDMSTEYFRVTHLIVGGFTDETPQANSKMDKKHIGNTVKYVLDNRDNFHVPIISLENDFWNKGQVGSGCNYQELKNRGRNYDLYR